MAYLGNAPARSFISFERQVFTIVNSQTAYTLSHSVTNENDIRLVVNNVVQEPGSGKAYTATGTTLTLSAALVNGTDEMYCVFLGRATATNAPGAGSVGTAQLAADAVTNAKIADDAISDEQLDPTVITGQTAETSIATDDLILLSDTSASGALKKMTRANFVSGIGGANTPAILVYRNTTQNISDNTLTKVELDTEVIDTDGTFASNKWTPAVAGTYFVTGSISYGLASNGDQADAWLYKNGAIVAGTTMFTSHVFAGDDISDYTATVSGLLVLDDNDYVELYARGDASGQVSINSTGGGGMRTFMMGYKLIT